MVPMPLDIGVSLVAIMLETSTIRTVLDSPVSLSTSSIPRVQRPCSTNTNSPTLISVWSAQWVMHVTFVRVH